MELRLVAACVGLRDAIAGIVVGVGEVALDARDGNETVVGVVGIGGGVGQRVGLAGLASGAVVTGGRTARIA